MCLNHTRIFKKDAVAAVVGTVKDHYSEHRIEAAIDARRSKAYQKLFFRHRIRTLKAKAAEEGRSIESMAAQESLAGHFKQRYDELSELGSSAQVIEHLTRFYVEDMASELNPAFFAFFRSLAYKKFSNFVKNIKLECSDEVVAEINSLMCKEPVFLMPNHISNADHIPICIAINAFGGPQPLIAAGANLFRGSSAKIMSQLNAYKIRREYIGSASRLMRVKWFQNPLYRRAHSEYLHYVWGNNEPCMFYVEGTRSRTGHMGAPKMGIGEEIFRFLSETGRSGYFIPISLSYTIVPEDEEIEAARKGENISNKDIFTQLSQLDREYGRYPNAPIYLRFGKPVKAEGDEDPAKFIKKIVETIKEGLVPTWTSRLALAINEDSGEHRGELFSLDNIKKVLLPEGEGDGEESKGLDIALETFLARGFIAHEKEELYRLTNPELLTQYANRLQ
jgi:hypothetical protein